MQCRFFQALGCANEGAGGGVYYTQRDFILTAIGGAKQNAVISTRTMLKHIGEPAIKISASGDLATFDRRLQPMRISKCSGWKRW